MSTPPVLAKYLQTPDDINALAAIPGTGVTATIRDIIQTLTLTILHLENSETVWLPKDAPVYLDPIATHAIECDADRRRILAASLTATDTNDE